MQSDEPETCLVFKIVSEADWSLARASGTYAGSPDDLRDGFIHLSAAHQVSGTLEKHFRDRAGLVLVAFDARALAPGLTWEPSRGGQLFPHLYGRLPASLALSVRPLPLGPHGVPQLPEDLASC